MKLTYLFLFVLLCFSVSAQSLIIKKQYYSLNEPVEIEILNTNPDYSLAIISPSNVYRYLGISSPLVYIPQTFGGHSVELYNSSNSELLSSVSFYVANPLNPFITLSKNRFSFKEQVRIEFSEISDSVIKITDNRKNYFFENPKSPLLFMPKDPDEYIITLEQGGKILALSSFSVDAKKKRFNIVDSKGKEILSSLNFYQKNKILASKTPEELDSDSFYENQTLDLEISPQIKGIEKIKFRNAKLKDRLDLRIEDLSLPNFVKSFAIDPTQMDFTDAIITGIAQGNALYKCKDWNFSLQICGGNWMKIMDINPGQEYTFNLTNQDPGYGESGSLPQPHTVKGYIFMADNVTRAENGIPVKIVNNNQSNYIMTQVYAPPVPQFKGAYSADLYGFTGDRITVKSWNETHYGYTDTILGPTSTEVNVSIKYPIGSEANVSIIYPPNNSVYNLHTLFNVTANIQIIRNNGTNCYATLALSNNIASFIGGSTLYIGNILVNSSVISMWNLTGFKEGTSNISVNASCVSDGHPLDDLNIDRRTNLTMIDQIKPEITLFYPYNSTEVTNVVRINFNVSDDSDVRNCSLFFNNALNLTVYPLMFDIYTINLTLAAGNYGWKIGCYDNSSYINYNETETRSFTLPSWQFYYGNISSRIALMTGGNASQFGWEDQEVANIYAVETGSSIDFAQLQALGRDIFNMSSNDDFHEADINLSMTAFYDSINRTYTINNAPVVTTTLEIYNKEIKNIPVFNSTNNTNFVTGILWDMSDGSTEYNGIQDIIFVTRKNITSYGKFGYYDYEMRVPATLKNYKQGLGTISFYVEIV
jgi:hypothetical protein